METPSETPTPGENTDENDVHLPLNPPPSQWMQITPPAAEANGTFSSTIPLPFFAVNDISVSLPLSAYTRRSSPGSFGTIPRHPVYESVPYAAAAMAQNSFQFENMTQVNLEAALNPILELPLNHLNNPICIAYRIRLTRNLITPLINAAAIHNEPIPPTPTPTYIYGFRMSAFSLEEQAGLQYLYAWGNNPCYPDPVFPFLVVEIRSNACSAPGLDRAILANRVAQQACSTALCILYRAAHISHIHKFQTACYAASFSAHEFEVSECQPQRANLMTSWDDAFQETTGERGQLGNKGDVEVFRRTLLNIIRWMVEKRLPVVKHALRIIGEQVRIEEERTGLRWMEFAAP